MNDKITIANRKYQRYLEGKKEYEFCMALINKYLIGQEVTPKFFKERRDKLLKAGLIKEKQHVRFYPTKQLRNELKEIYQKVKKLNI